ncbi:MAG: hypothetical protein ACJ795_19865, partial [Ktedonobacteraceae bacterium]
MGNLQVVLDEEGFITGYKETTSYKVVTEREWAEAKIPKSPGKYSRLLTDLSEGRIIAMPHPVTKKRDSLLQALRKRTRAMGF